MLQVDNKFKTMFEAKTWNAPFPEEERSWHWKHNYRSRERRRRKPSSPT